jgi:RecB family exonuclease
MAPAPFHVPEGSLAIENTEELREQLRRRTWSFTSLKKFFTCPCRFILEDIQKVAPPSCFEDEDSANLLIGNFLHRFFAELKEHRPAIEQWRERFDESWERDRDIQEKLPDRAVRKAIVRSHLADIAAWEKETGRPLLFSDEVTGTELLLTAPFGGGRYQLRGRIDRLQPEGDRQLITDLKYKEKKPYSEKDRLADRLEKADSFDDRFQLLIYAYLALHNKKATPDKLDVAHLFLRPRVRGDYEGRLGEEDLAACDATLEGIAARLDALLAQERFTPNFRAADCAYCPHKALCLKPDLYRTGGRPW